jgi:hypothetical protein
MVMCNAASAQDHRPTAAEAEVLGLLESKGAAAGIKLARVDHVKLGALKDEGSNANLSTSIPRKPMS